MLFGRHHDHVAIVILIYKDDIVLLSTKMMDGKKWHEIANE